MNLCLPFRWLDLAAAYADRYHFNDQACDRMLALKYQCIHPTSQEPYIKSSTGGVNNSPEDAAVRRHRGDSRASWLAC